MRDTARFMAEPLFGERFVPISRGRGNRTRSTFLGGGMLLSCNRAYIDPPPFFSVSTSSMTSKFNHSPRAAHTLASYMKYGLGYTQWGAFVNVKKKLIP